MKMRIVAAGLTAAAAGLIGSRDAHAWLQFCNGTSDTVNVAISFHDPYTCGALGDWRDKGWWVMSPGECKTALGGDLDNSTYYYYAFSKSSTWSGDTYVDCVPLTVFDQCDAYCLYPDTATYGFRTIKTGGVDNYTLHLTP